MKFKTESLFLLGAVLLALFAAASVMAQSSQTNNSSQFEDFKGDGYYWYKKDPLPPKPKKKEEEKPPEVAAAVPAKPTEDTPLSSAWLKKNMPKLLDLAVDNPTPENVANYYYAQRVLLDKSQNFSESARAVIATDPYLDENNRVPIAQYGQMSFAKALDEGQTAALNYLGANGGLWVFVDEPERCSACEAYVNDVMVGIKGVPGVAVKYGFDFRKIYVNTPEGRAAAKRLDLKVTPTTVFVLPPDKFYLVSQGLLAQPQLVDRIMVAAKLSGKLPKELLEKATPYQKDLLTKEDMQIAGNANDPSAVMKSLRNRIKGEKQ
jgi:conjugal transfer pilus assembly protein TraF